MHIVLNIRFNNFRVDLFYFNNSTSIPYTFPTSAMIGRSFVADMAIVCSFEYAHDIIFCLFIYVKIIHI